MLPKNEIKALFNLIDDPDDEVYETVAEKIVHYGKEIVPSLEYLWETTEDELAQYRITQLIHRVHFADLMADFKEWANSEKPELIRGAILVAQYHYPDMNVPFLLTQFDQIRRNLWLELNNYLTPIEKINVFNGILYNYYKLVGHELTENNPERFFINKVLESKQGNVFSFSVLYVALAEILDIPIFAMGIPRQFLLGYVDNLQHFYSTDNSYIKQISFFVDAVNGMIYTHKDIDYYLHKIGEKGDRSAFFVPKTSVEIISLMITELATCYLNNNEEEKAEELANIIMLLSGTSNP